MGGGFLQLAAYGAQDVYLTGNPQITFFVAVYKRYTNFSIENVRQYFTGQPDFGKRVYCQVERIGDLMSETFLVVDLPSLKPFTKKDNEIYWVNSIGNALIKFIEIEIGGVIIDRHFGLWLQIWGELTVASAQIRGYNKMIGRTPDKCYFDNQDEYKLYIPLYFWFCKNRGLALPLIALQNHEVRINVAFRNITELLVTKNNNLDEYFNNLDRKNRKFNSKHTKHKKLCSELSISSAHLYIDYIYLEDSERRFFAQKNHQYLIEQLQINSTTLYSRGRKGDPINTMKNNNKVCNLDKSSEVPKEESNNQLDYGANCIGTIIKEHLVNLDFYHPIKEFIMVLQNSNILTGEGKKREYAGNEWFNFGIDDCDSNHCGSDCYNNDNDKNSPIQTLELYIEGKERFRKRDYKYFNLIQPWQRHTNIPNNWIYCYSFAFEPENSQPTGTCNFSRIDNSHFMVEINGEIVNPVLTIFGTNYNILKIKGGMAGVAYSN